LNGHHTAAQLSFPPLTPAIRLIAIVTGAAYLAEIVWVHWVAEAVLPELADAGPAAVGLAVRKMQLALHPPDVVQGRVWELATYLLVHDPVGPFHVIFNLLFCWLFGSEFEMRWGSRRFLRFYVASGVLAGLFVVAWSAAVPGEWNKLTLGSSGAVYALIAAYAVMFPNRQMWPIPIRVKTFVWVLVGLTCLYFLARTEASFAAHIGGLGAGWLITTGNWRPGRLLDRIRLWQLKRKRSRMFVVHGEGGADRNGDGGRGGPGEEDDGGGRGRGGQSGQNGRILH